MKDQKKPEIFGENRYYSLNRYFQNTFGEKVYRLSIDGGFTCPNRDGTVGTGGCSFCSAGGSGDFAADRIRPISEQLLQARELIAGKTANCRKYLAYFQAYTNTYAGLDELREKYEQALEPEYIVGMSVATRPDCLSDEVIGLLAELSKKKAVYVELGVQTIHERSLQEIGSGFTFSDSRSAIERLHAAGIPVIVHLILGLPKENRQDMIDSVRTVCALPIHGIKLQLLHILRDTRLAGQYEKKPFDLFEPEAYADFVIDLLELIPKHVVIYRLTGDGPKKLLLAPLWSGDKKRVLNLIQKRLRERDTWQARCCST